MDEGRTTAPAAYVEMHAAGASAREVFEKARIDGYKNLDCAFIVAGLFNMDFLRVGRTPVSGRGIWGDADLEVASL